MKRSFIQVLACVAVMVVMTEFASAAVIYSDTFTRTTGSGDPNGNPAGAGNGFSSWGTNDNGLGGTVSQAYFVGPTNRTGGANQTTDGNLGTLISGGTTFGFDATTVAPNGFRVAFDFNRFHPINPGSGNGFIAVGFGKAVPADPNTYGGLGAIAGSDFAILFQQSTGGNAGNTQFFQDDLGAANTFLPGTGATGPLDYGSPTATHSVVISLTPTTSGAYGDSDVINFSVVVDGGSSYSSTVLGGDNFGNLAFSANPSVHRYIDNLVVSTIPEPTSSLLIGLGTLVVFAIRRNETR
jgi:hypothetical protein